MLFKKPFIQGSKNLVGNKDRKRLKNSIVERFQCTLEEVDAILLPKTSDVEVLSLRGSKVQIYFSQGIPVLFDIEAGELYPTLYALIKLPNLLPAFIIHSEVSAFIMKGADLMVPGILEMPTTEGNSELSMSQRCMGVRVTSNPIPFAVGKCLINELSGGKGKALEVFHLFGDYLWELGSRVAPSGFTVKRILASSSAASEGLQCSNAEVERLTEALESSQIDSDLIPENGSSEAPPSTLSTSESPMEPPVHHAPRSDEEEAEVVEAAAADPVVGGDVEMLRPSLKPTTAAISSIVVDTFLEFCLLETLHTDITNAVLPMPVSAVFSRMTGHAGEVQFSKPFRQRLLALNVPTDDVSSVLSHSALPCDVKKSSHKKLSKFFQHYTKLKLLQSKEVRGDLILMSVNRDSPLYKSYATVTKEDKKYAVKALGLETTAASGEDAGTNAPAFRKTGFQVLEFFQPDEYSRIIFETSEIHPSIAESYFDAAQCREALVSYIKRTAPSHNSLMATAGEVTLSDPTLQRCVLPKDQCSPPESCAPRVMAFKDVYHAFLSKLTVFHAVVKADSDLTTTHLPVRRGKMKPIEVQSKTRAGNKAITSIGDVSAFGIDAKNLAETLQKLLAASATVYEIPGAAKGKSKKYGVFVQGRFENAICEILINQYGIPKQCISTE